MNVTGLVYIAAFWFLLVSFGWKVAIGSLAFVFITNLALAT